MQASERASTSGLVLAAVELMGRSGRDGVVRVQGDSMRPTLQAGQLLAVEFAVTSMSRGDMLLFRQGDALLVHRLLGRARSEDGRPRFRTRGDGVAVLDPPVDLERVVGRVVAVGDGERWRSTRTAMARAYGRSLAWHSLFWAGVGGVLRRMDARLARAHLAIALHPAAAAVDRWLLRCVHSLLFRRLHPIAPGPDPPER